MMRTAYIQQLTNGMFLHRGFSLVEMAIVLLIVGLLLGSILMPLSSQIESNQRKDAAHALEDIKEALLGFAVANDRLPCPARPVDAGVESFTGTVGASNCSVQHGFVPAVTLGLSGGRNQDGLLLDPWNNPIRYSITNSNSYAFVKTNGIVLVSSPLSPNPDLKVCSTTAGSTSTACAAGMDIANNAVAVIYSMGKDWGVSPVSSEQQENQGGTLGGGPSGINYPIANDIVFVDRDYNNAPGTEFDDVISWLSPNTLFSRMVAGGVLP